jgi:pimeloyl-ACP methyl ester carboxylesterase
VVVLLHGLPTSSYMYRRLIPELADRYHLIAPDYLGFGQSAMPLVDEFEYTFDSITDVVRRLLDQLGVDRFAMYVQDYGAPVGWRLASRQPDRITAIISQNGNAYSEGLFDERWAPTLAYAKDPSPETEAPIRQRLSPEAVREQYLTGTPDPTLVSPESVLHDATLLQRPGNTEIQLSLFRDYATNIARYPAFQAYFRASRVPLLAVWGANDRSFGPDGARAFNRDLPEAEVHLLDAGHFALETDLDTIASYSRGFLGRVLAH